MNINNVFEDPRIKMLEEEIANWNENCSYSDEEKHVPTYLLEQRRNKLNQMIVYDDEMKRMLIDFNERLRKACNSLYSKVMTIYEEYMGRNDYFGDFEVEGKIFLSYQYPQCHPIQSNTAHRVWDALSVGGFEPLYSEGFAWSLRFSKEYPPSWFGHETFEKWIGMDDETDNWNEGLDQEWSKNLHLIQPFHNLFEHCGFSLYDLIYVREFHLKVNLSFEGEASC